MSKIRDFKWWLAILILISVMVIAIQIRVPNMLERDIWFDEAFSILHAQKPITTLLTVPQDVHPPLYYVLLHIFGSSGIIYSGRMISLLLFGVFVPSLATFADELSSTVRKQLRPNMYIVAMIIAFFSPTLVYYSTETRMYMLAMVLCAWAWIMFMRWLRQENTSSLIMHHVFLVLLALTHYYTFVVGIMTVTFLAMRYRSRLRSYLVHMLWFVPLYVYVIWYFFVQFSQATRLWLQSTQLLSIPSTWVYYLFKPDGSHINSTSSAYISMFIFIVLMYGTYRQFMRYSVMDREEKTDVATIAALAFFVPTIGLSIAVFTGAYHHRYFLVAAVPLYATLAAMIGSLVSNRFELVRTLLLVALVASLGTYDYTGMDELQEIGTYLSEHSDESMLVLHTSMFSMAPSMIYASQAQHVLASIHLNRSDMFTAGGAVIDHGTQAYYPMEMEGGYVAMMDDIRRRAESYERVYYLRSEEADLFCGAGEVVLDLDGIDLVTFKYGDVSPYQTEEWCV